MDNDEYNSLNNLLKATTDKAINDSFRLGIPITIVEDGWIVKKYPNGSIIGIKHCKSEVYIEKKIYKL